MLRKKDNKTKQTTFKSSDSSITFVAEDCEIHGSINSSGNARIEGKIEGTINIGGDLVIGQNALIKANIEAQTVTIAGEVHGNIKAKDLLELSSTARLYGDINTKQLKIDQGARFVGKSTYIDENDSTAFYTNRNSFENNESEVEE